MFESILKVFFIFAVFSNAFAARLQTSGSTFTYNGQQVYLNGVNIAWNNYGYDFGNGGYDGTLDEWLREIGNAGGNAVRMWVHVEGYSTPTFDSDGYVTGCDSSGTFYNDVTTFLNTAQANNILVILTLWNGAVSSNQNEINLIWDDSKLDSYINNCLIGFVSYVAGHPALAAWEAVNEPEGAVLVASDPNPCYDTTAIGADGAGWSGAYIPMERFLIFIGRINQVVHQYDSSGLTTVGSWSQFSQTDAFSGCKNYYSDSCLNGAVGGSGANIDFYQMHTYDWSGSWSPNAPFTVSASDYGLDKPVLIGEFSSSCGAGTSITDLIEHGYSYGYGGTLSWHWAATGDCTDSRDTQSSALGHLSGRTDHGSVDFTVG